MPALPWIAIVDDEEPIRRALLRLMRSAGLESRSFASGPDLLDAMRTDPPRCIVLDLHMPGMCGFEVQEQLSREWPAIPVIFVTGHHSPESHARAVASGASAYLLKPMNDQLLLDAIAHALILTNH